MYFGYFWGFWGFGVFWGKLVFFVFPGFSRLWFPGFVAAGLGFGFSVFRRFWFWDLGFCCVIWLAMLCGLGYCDLRWVLVLG